MYKCSSLCDNMYIYLNKDSPMYLKYKIKNSGEMLVGISPTMDSNGSENDDYDEDDDQYYDDDSDYEIIE